MKCRKKQVKALLNILTSQEGPWFKELVAALNSCIENPEYQKLAETLDPSNVFHYFRGAVWVANNNDIKYKIIRLHTRATKRPL